MPTRSALPTEIKHSIINAHIDELIHELRSEPPFPLNGNDRITQRLFEIFETTAENQVRTLYLVFPDLQHQIDASLKEYSLNVDKRRKKHFHLMKKNGVSFVASSLNRDESVYLAWESILASRFRRLESEEIVQQ